MVSGLTNNKSSENGKVQGANSLEAKKMKRGVAWDFYTVLYIFIKKK